MGKISCSMNFSNWSKIAANRGKIVQDAVA